MALSSEYFNPTNSIDPSYLQLRSSLFTISTPSSPDIITVEGTNLTSQHGDAKYEFDVDYESFVMSEADFGIDSLEATQPTGQVQEEHLGPAIQEYHVNRSSHLGQTKSPAHTSSRPSREVQIDRQSLVASAFGRPSGLYDSVQPDNNGVDDRLQNFFNYLLSTGIFTSPSQLRDYVLQRTDAWYTSVLDPANDGTLLRSTAPGSSEEQTNPAYSFRQRKKRHAKASPTSATDTSCSSPKTSHKPYSCTVPGCNKSWKSACEWKRHEAQHYKPWTCMPQGTPIVEGVCVICGEEASVPELHHDHYKMGYCLDMPPSARGRSFRDVDKLEEHLDMHLGREAAEKLDTVSRDRRRQKANEWGVCIAHPDDALWCGFYLFKCFSWDERQDHILKHLKDGMAKEQWVPRPA